MHIPPHTHSRTARGRLAALGTLAALAILTPLTAAPALADAHAPAAWRATASEQVIDPEQQQGSGRVVRGSGHLDFGPTLTDGTWRLQIHDDSEATSYWRDLDDVAIWVTDGAKLTVPDAQEFAFLPADPGTEVYVIPQTQQPGIVWLGWNTQQPDALANMGQGVSVSITSVSGPGEASVFLQNGNFGAPDELWNTAELPGTIWMERNTHTHANWVFTAPGAYLLDVTFEADLSDGTSVSVSDSLRFAVGDATDPESVFALEGGESAAGGGGGSTAADEAQRDGGPLTDPALAWAAAGLGAAAIAGITVAAFAFGRRRARRRTGQPDPAAPAASTTAPERRAAE